VNGAGPDDLEALVPPPPAVIHLGGQTYPLAPLTLGRYAAARRFAGRFGAALQAEDVIEALLAVSNDLWDDFALATGIPRAAIAEADAAEAIAASFALVRGLADFTAGPLVAALAGGAEPPVRTAARRGERSSPGLSGADTR
jgi:hypothetical protein